LKVAGAVKSKRFAGFGQWFRLLEQAYLHADIRSKPIPNDIKKQQQHLK
jgi:hypothetical protein